MTTRLFTEWVENWRTVTSTIAPFLIVELPDIIEINGETAF
jgi:hypothetical protein